MKSFSQLTKEELYKLESANHCCDIAELAGLILFGASIRFSDKEVSIKFMTENQDVLGCFVNLCRKENFEPIVKQISDDSIRYVAKLDDTTHIMQLLVDLDIFDIHSGKIRLHISPNIVKKNCCKRAFLRGVFMGAGTVIDPRKNYNLEIVSSDGRLLEDLYELLQSLSFNFRHVMRKSKHVLYIKNSETISDILTFMGAYKAQMELINIKIEKEIRNDVNRTANSETANISKTINAAVEQIKAIERVEKYVGLDNIPEDLREIAELRLKHKDLSLSELGALLNPPLSKSGVNHRMQKIMKMV